MAQRERPLSPHLQVYKLQYTMVLSITHRITGVLLSLGSLLLVYWLVALALGRDHYATAHHVLSSIPARIVWAGLILAFCYHLVNGVRHLAWDCGLGLEKRQARTSGWVVVIIAIVVGAAVIVYAFDLAGSRA